VCLRRGHALGSKQPGWRYPSADWVRLAERFVLLERQLPDVLAGKLEPASRIELLEYIEVCTLTQRFSGSARLYAQAFAGEAKLAADLRAGHRYNAACDAARAGTGQGKDAGTLDTNQRAEMRYRALGWLQDDLAAHTRALGRNWVIWGKPSYQALLHWQKDVDLAAVRDPVALGKLPEAEQVAWRNLWARVGALLARVTPGKGMAAALADCVPHTSSKPSGTGGSGVREVQLPGCFLLARLPAAESRPAVKRMRHAAGGMNPASALSDHTGGQKPALARIGAVTGTPTVALPRWPGKAVHRLTGDRERNEFRRYALPVPPTPRLPGALLLDGVRVRPRQKPCQLGQVATTGLVVADAQPANEPGCRYEGGPRCQNC
jgi:hypothetical protein